MPTTLKKKAVKGTLWSAIERFSTQGIQFIIGLILARLLTPTDYGLLGMLAIFIAISRTFIDGGFAQALIQKKNRDELDFSTTFYFNIVVSLFVYAILFFAAPLIADFYQEPLLVELTRVIGVIIIINSFSVVQIAKFSIQVDFKTQTKATLTAVVISGAIGIYMAYSGFGVWALVVQRLTMEFIKTILLWLMSKWIPAWQFSVQRFKQLFSFGSKLLLSRLLDTVFVQIYTVVIGKVFSADTLGYFTRARQFSELPSQNITGIIQRVTFPVLSEIQDNDEKLREAYKKIIIMSATLIFPLMIGLAAVAKPFVLLVLTEKWSSTVWMLQLLCFAMMWYPIHAINLNVINVKGRSDLFLKLEVIKKIITFVILVITVPMGLEAILVGQIVDSYICLFINLHYTKKVINYGFLQQMRDLLPILLLSLAMGGLVYYTISYLFVGLYIFQLVLGLIVGILFYVGIAWFTNIGNIKDMVSLIKNKY